MRGKRRYLESKKGNTQKDGYEMVLEEDGYKEKKLHLQMASALALIFIPTTDSQYNMHVLM